VESKSELLNNTFWWNGPEWLTQDDKNGVSQPCFYKPDEEVTLPEIKPVQLAFISSDSSKDLVQYYSSWKKRVRAIGWLNKFIEFLITRTVN